MTDGRAGGEIERRLGELGIELPPPFTPVANYVRAVRAGSLVFVSGHGPTVADAFPFRGKIDSAVSVEEGYRAARLTLLNCLATLRDELGSLDRIRRIVKLLGMVNADPGFERHPAVVDGASDLLVEIFGERGRHARSAVGVASLPFDISVEIELVAELDE